MRYTRNRNVEYAFEKNLTDEEVAEIEKALARSEEDFKNGRWIDHEEFKRRVWEHIEEYKRKQDKKLCS